MTPSVCMLWVQSMHSSATIHNAMTLLTDHCHKTSEQHEKLGKTRIQRDFCDLQKILEQLGISNPFDSGRTDLISLYTGMIADKRINCDDVEEVSRSIQSKLDGSLFTKSTMKRADQVKAFSHLKNAVKINKQNIVTDPSKLFTRLIVLLERCDDITPYFQYELTPVPTSLFLDNMMCKPNKSSLIQSLLGRDYQLFDSNDIVSTEHNVVDGGALLRKLVWKQDTTFENIAELYGKYVQAKYRGAAIVFDGYGNNSSKKDHEHLRRSLKTATCPM